MKLPDEEVERLAKHLLTTHRATFCAAWNLSQDQRLIAARFFIKTILSELPEPTLPSWATPEAKAVLDCVAIPRGEIPYSHEWAVMIANYHHSLQPKTVELPECWHVVVKNAAGLMRVAQIHYSAEEANNSRLVRMRAGIVRHIPAQQIAEPK